MVVPSNLGPVQELRTADGQVFAMLVARDEFARMQAELQALREQVATLQRQKNHYVNELIALIKSSIPIPPSPEQIAAAKPNSEELSQLIADLEAN